MHYGRVWHSVRLISLSFTSATIAFSGRIENDARIDFAVPGFEPKQAMVSRIDEDRVDLVFETPIPWTDLTGWCDAARRSG